MLTNEFYRHSAAKVQVIDALNNIAKNTGLNLIDILYVTESVCTEQRLNIAITELASYEKELAESTSNDTSTDIPQTE